MAQNEVKIAGLKELLEGLSALPEDLGKSTIYSSLGGAGKVVKDEAVRRVPVLQTPTDQRKSGTVKNAIRVSRSKINKGAQGLWEIIVRVKPLKGRQVAKFKKETGLKSTANPDDPYYWWWLEFGTSKMAKRPFLRPAFDTTKDAQLSAIRKRMFVGLERSAKKIAERVSRGT